MTFDALIEAAQPENIEATRTAMNQFDMEQLRLSRNQFDLRLSRIRKRRRRLKDSIGNELRYADAPQRSLGSRVAFRLTGEKNG